MFENLCQARLITKRIHASHASPCVAWTGGRAVVDDEVVYVVYVYLGIPYWVYVYLGIPYWVSVYLKLGIPYMVYVYLVRGIPYVYLILSRPWSRWGGGGGAGA